MRRRTWLMYPGMVLAMTLGVARADTTNSLAAVFGGQGELWKVASGEFSIEHDPALGADVLSVATNTALTLESQTAYPDAQEIRARVRLRTDGMPNPWAYFHFGLTNAADTGFYVQLVANRGISLITANVLDRGRPLHDLAALSAKSDWDHNFAYAYSFGYYLRAYEQILPGWEENYRAQIEDAMARLPDLEHKWADVRIQYRKGLVRVWLDDRLVATREDPALDGQGLQKINLGNGLQLASYTVMPWSDDANFLPVELGHYANARAFLGKASVDPASLPPAGKPAMVEGVPFIFAGVNVEGNDHIDVGQSFLRQANEMGYLQTYGANGRWNGAGFRDPARIQIRIPNAGFDAIYFIAASDGEPTNIPLVSAMFYRPQAGYAESFETRVPVATATGGEAKPLPVTLSNGKKTNLWLVKMPLDREKLTALSDMDIVEVEFTKQVQLYRSYPDPISYGWHQGGLPSGVHIYAATFSRSPITFDWQPDRFGHVWTAPEVPAYTATLTNRSTAAITGKLTVTTRSFDGTEETKQEAPITIAPGQAAQAKFSLPVKLNGYHDITASLETGGQTWAERRSFVRHAPDTRSAKWTEGRGGLFRWWSYGGGHYTPKGEHHVRLMTAAGARTEPPTMGNPWFVSPQAWAVEDQPDPAKVEEFKASIVKQVQEHESKLPPEKRADDLYMYPEPHISRRLTAGNYPEYWGDPPFEYTEEEKHHVKMFMVTSRIAAETYRATFPGRKILIPWGDPLFIVPLLRAGFPKELIDGSAVDVPGFERIPERQLHEQSIHRLYQLKREYEKAGIPHPRLQFNEGIFVPTEPGSVTWREQMDIYHRWTLLSMAYGVTRFYSGWFAFDCGNYYGAEHYGGCGIQRRIPYCDPKPAYAAYATMTDKLNEANFDGWLKTGSHTTYCLRFKHDTRGFIYALWTLRGKRPVTLTLSADAKAGVTDSMNNTKEVASQDKRLTVMTDQSVIYVTGAGEVMAVAVGDPDNSDDVPAKDARQIADLGDGSWKYTADRDEVYEHNHWGIYPAAGKFSAAMADDAGHGRVLVSKLEKQARVREVMPWYSVLKPAKPIRLDGAPSHLGLWVKGNSDWGRFIYIVRDAKGERWISIGTKDDYNCDDAHSWSSFNFDGWRYLRFELPGHLGWDNFRKHGATWWGSSAKAVSSPTGKPNGDDIVDLPLTLEEIIVEQRSHILYVNDVQPVAGDTVSFGKLYVEYERPEDSSAEAVKESRLRMPRPKTPDLPNQIARLTKEGVGAPTKLLKLTPPTHYYDGTRMQVHFAEVPGAKKYTLWVGAYEDGRGAVNLVPAGIANNQLVTGLRPSIKLYYWITYTDANDKESKPSPVHAEVTVDNFKEK